jgi:hypothetical protein
VTATQLAELALTRHMLYAAVYDKHGNVNPQKFAAAIRNHKDNWYGEFKIKAESKSRSRGNVYRLERKRAKSAPRPTRVPGAGEGGETYADGYAT